MIGALPQLAKALREGGRVAAEREAAGALQRALAVPGAVIHAAPPELIAARLDAVDWSAPFAGVPILIKDTAPEAGCPFTFGSRTLADHVAEATGAMPAALAALGFVSVGRTATPEFGLSDTTEPLTTGPVANPWGRSLSPGGSSGGAAAAVAAGAVPFAHGSDGGGSLRQPAALTGMVSLKPTRGALLPSIVQAEPWMPAMGESFGIACDVPSLAAVFAALRREAPVCAPPRRLHLAMIASPLHGRACNPVIEGALHAAADLLRRLGHEVTPAAWPFDAPAFHAAFFDLFALRAELDLDGFERMFNRPLRHDLLEGWTRGLMAHGAAQGSHGRERIAAALAAAERGMSALFESVDLIITPVTGRPVLHHGEHHGERAFPELQAAILDNVCYTPVHNMLGTPSLALPLGGAPDGRPIGMQIAGPRGCDHLLLSLGLELAALHPFPRPPTWAGNTVMTKEPHP
ncbi:MAG: amidase family protein [Alphaproteobacteria bacterium]|nr:amidase family protein [Alphaproteobacteria bacterium]